MTPTSEFPRVVAVSASARHTFRKPNADRIVLVEGLGVEGDAHCGTTVKHRSRVAKDPTQPNLRQVHLIHAELHEELRRGGYALEPGEMGENITTQGLDILALPTGTRLRLGATAEIEITGLRNPCLQLDRLRPGLMQATLDKDERGNLVRKAGVMAIVLTSGEVAAGDAISVDVPPPPHRPLRPV
jgi:MOSC domain-containing protein YiiM